MSGSKNLAKHFSTIVSYSKFSEMLRCFDDDATANVGRRQEE